MSDRGSAMRKALAANVIAAFLGAAPCAARYAVHALVVAPTGAPAASSASAAGPSDSSVDIRDIRGPKVVFPAWLLPALVAGGVLFALGAYGVWRWWRRGRRPPLTPLPFEVALRRLEDIRALMAPASARAFSIAVSDIVRSYIEQRFDVTATHRTTEEFLHDLVESTNATLARHRALLSEFLHQCDLVKFAGMSLTLENMESLRQSARAFVRETAAPEELPQTRNSQHSSGEQEGHDSLPST